MSLKHKVIITDTSVNSHQVRMCATVSERRMLEVRCRKLGQESILGNIYVGRVQKIVPNIQAAFIEIKPGLSCYYSMEEKAAPVFAKKIPSSRLVQGDELLVQVTRESVKTKAPTVSGNLNLTGRYLVVTSGDCRLSFSSKLTKVEKEQFRILLEPEWDGSYGIIVRTNAKEAEAPVLLAELQQLKTQLQSICDTAAMRTCFSCVSRTPESYMGYLKNSRQEGLIEIVTDLPQVYEQIEQQQFSEPVFAQIPVRLYEDPLLPLAALYNLNKQTEEALQPKVWMKSGGYLVIQPTEALTVVDINTGKYTGKKKKDDTFLKINLEAARELARQLRLRNLSGIIIVDFVDMEDPEDEQRLLETMREQLKYDPMKAAAVDITSLGLMEVTRKKQRKTLKEQAKECGIL